MDDVNEAGKPIRRREPSGLNMAEALARCLDVPAEQRWLAVELLTEIEAADMAGRAEGWKPEWNADDEGEG